MQVTVHPVQGSRVATGRKTVVGTRAHRVRYPDWGTYWQTVTGTLHGLHAGTLQGEHVGTLHGEHVGTAQGVHGVGTAQGMYGVGTATGVGQGAAGWTTYGVAATGVVHRSPRRRQPSNKRQRKLGNQGVSSGATRGGATGVAGTPVITGGVRVAGAGAAV
jgi:hypothetical protein